MTQETLKELPKIELHCHLDGSLSRPFIEKRLGRTVRPEELSVSENCTSLNEYLEKFDLPGRCIMDEEGLSGAAYDLLSQMNEENVCYAEIRFAPLLSETKKMDSRKVIEAVISGMEQGKKDFGIEYGVIVCAMRHHSTEDNMRMIKTAREYLGSGVCAADLAGAEALYPMSEFMDIFTETKKMGMPFTLHAGECGNPQNVIDSINVGAGRIGHGIAMRGNQEIRKMAKKAGIGIEMCPISNLQTKSVNSMAEYPMREFLDAGCDTALMEVSSQGLMMDRVAGVHYDVGVFTNLSPDHIGPGEHKTFEEYRSWKGQLFRRCDVGVVNIDDENTEALLEGHTCKLVTYGCSEKADYRAGTYQLLRTHDFLGVQFHVSGKDDMDVKVNMPGEFSVYNALAALTVGKVLGLPDEAIHEGLGRCVVKGRVELVPISRKFTILLDYAHNEVSTESLLTTLRAYDPHRLVVVFGCGGNRSKLRRYGMGEICAKMADFSILTEDNNRFEKVEDIIADIRVGMNKGNPDAKFVEIPDRLDALHYAVDHAQEGDLIAVIGKGHETYRDREGVKTPFLERELLEEYAQQIGLE